MVPFAGWEMPVWYSSVIEEHKATRQAAGLFDVSHMGVCDASGPNACAFLDTITANDVSALEVGNSHYNYLLGVDGVPIDDMMIYRIEAERYLIVINASNNDKDWAWMNAVNEGKVAIDSTRPWARNTALTVLRDLRDRPGADHADAQWRRAGASLETLRRYLRITGSCQPWCRDSRCEGSCGSPALRALVRSRRSGTCPHRARCRRP
jgi:hypothetical protein